MAIFRHMDTDGDAAEILTEPEDLQEDVVLWAGSRKGSAVQVRLDRDAQERLINALQEHRRRWAPGRTTDMAIFEHEDSAGDAFKITGSPRVGELALYWAEDNASYVNLPRSAVRSLRDALNRWLDEQQRHDPNPAGSNTAPPYETLVRRLVAEEVARVMPLHQSPQAAALACECARGVHSHVFRPCPNCDCQAFPEPEPQHASNTGLALCTVPNCPGPPDFHAEHDPEPQAVGHPEAPGIDWTDKSGVRYEYCTECGHVWGAHSPSDVRHGCGAILGKGRCGCEAIRADQRPPVAPDSSRYDGEGEPVKAECTCRRHEHRPGATRRCEYPGCFCRRQS